MQVDRDPTARNAPQLTDVDVAVVEISTLRRHAVGGFELYAHEVYGEAIAAGSKLPTGAGTDGLRYPLGTTKSHGGLYYGLRRSSD